MRVLLTSHGSTGDIYPMIRLGHALLDAGHTVRFATVTLFREEIEAAGMEYVYAPPDWEQAGFAEAMRDLAQAKHGVEVLKLIYAESVPFIDEIFQCLEAQMGCARLRSSPSPANGPGESARDSRPMEQAPRPCFSTAWLT